MMGIPSEEYNVRFHHRANIPEALTQTQITVYCSPRLDGVTYCSWATNLYSRLLY